MATQLSKKYPIVTYMCSILFCEVVGNIPTPATINSINSWYLYLNKPFFNPPNWLFGPVWTILFLLMGISLGIIWRKNGNLFWFWIQLVLNVLWSFLFFGLKSPGIALIEILLFLFTIVMTIHTFKKTSKTAAYLLFPYVAWVSFATLLNAAIWWLN